MNRVLNTAKTGPSAARGNATRWRPRLSGALVFFASAVALFSLLSPRFLTPQNLAVIASNAAILSVVSAAQAIVLLTRNVDVSVGSIMGLTAYLTCDVAAHHPQIGPELIVLALALGAFLGALNGLLVAYARVSSLIATLATMSLYRGATYLYAHGQEITSTRLPRWMLRAVDARVGEVPALVLACFAVVGCMALFLRCYPLGRRIYAAGSNPLAGVYYGLRIERVVLVAYALGGTLCGLAGLMYAARIGTVTVVLATGWELSSLAAAVIGGVSVAGGSGSVLGATVGALTLACVDNGLVLLGIQEFWRMFIQGSAIVGASTIETLARPDRSSRPGFRKPGRGP